MTKVLNAKDNEHLALAEVLVAASSGDCQRGYCGMTTEEGNIKE